MKKIGEYTARGVVTEIDTEAGRPKRIPLFDGSFKTGYKVVEFKIWGANYGSSSTNPDVIGKLATNDDGVTTASNFMRADDENQIAWAASAAGLDGGGAPFQDSIVDPVNLVIEDLYVYARITGTNTNPINYLVVMEKYEFTEGRGALTMAASRAMGG